MAGKKRINITPNTDVRDYDPELDSKGELVSYTSDRDGNENIYAVNIITLEKKQITNSVNDEWDSHPLPDGSAIVYLFKSKEKHMICMKEMKEGAQEKIVQKSLTLKYDQLDVSDKGIAYIRSTGSSHAIDYYIFNAEKPITFPGAKGVNCFPQINETEYLSWVTINPDKSVSINITKTTGLPKDYKTVTLYGAEFLSSDREIIHKVSKDGKNIYTFVKEDKNLIFKKINNPYIE
ncbi:MAG: hypothetical protein HY738_00220 [Bacteroidia bacterium]|nr:hypothetical protein [Bacteroidia bacterium]